MKTFSLAIPLLLMVLVVSATPAVASVTPSRVSSSSIRMMAPSTDGSMYPFETGVDGWTHQTYTDSQAITSVAHDTSKAYLGNGSLKAAVDLVPGDSHNSKGEAWVNMTTNAPPNATTSPPYDLSTAIVYVAVWVPAAAQGASSAPNGIQVFFKDNTGASKYSHWMNIGMDVPINEWYQISIRMASEAWSYDGGANLTKIVVVGVKIGANSGATAVGFAGDIWIDSFDWRAPPMGFVTAIGDKFAVDGKTFFYNGMNQYYLFYKSHKMVNEVIEDAAAMGLTVIRTWAFCDGQLKDGYCFQPAPGVYWENTSLHLDYVIYKAKEYKMRLVLPLVNNWPDMGGMSQYANWSPTASVHDEFYTDQWCRDTFKAYINYTLNRVNNYTGVTYKNDPTIMMWEVANEPRCQSDSSGATLQNWINEMASYIKSIDQNHMVSTGEEGFYSGGSGWMYDGSQGTSYIANHYSPYVDACSFHLYPDTWSLSRDQSLTWIAQHINDAHEKIGKPAYLGEFGWQVNRSAPDAEQQMGIRNSVYTDWYDRLNETNADGAMFWLLSGHQDDDTLYPDYDHFTVYYPEDSATCTIIQTYSDTVLAKSGLPILPTIVLTPDSGYTPTMISGKYFPTAGSTITVTWEGIQSPLSTVPTVVTVDNGRRFTALVNLPTLTPGKYNVTATDENGASASATFTVESMVTEGVIVPQWALVTLAATIAGLAIATIVVGIRYKSVERKLKESK